MSGNTYVGKPIYLVSHSDVKYKGILAGIDKANSTIQLSKVYSMGTENRRPPEEFIPPNSEPYEYIIFRASEVKDLAVDDQPMPMAVSRTVTDDPAVLNASVYTPPPLPVQQQQQQQSQQQQQPRNSGSASGPNPNNRRRKQQPAAANTNEPLTIPTTDFDFASSNAKFSKPGSPDNEDSEEKEKAYNPQKSFFDTLSPGPVPSFASGPRGGGRGGPRGGAGGRGGRGGRRREEERERNVATFGEPGGVGLLGPGAYVGGWGGYGSRRGGGGGGAARGGGRRGPPSQNQNQVVG